MHKKSLFRITVLSFIFLLLLPSDSMALPTNDTFKNELSQRDKSKSQSVKDFVSQIKDDFIAIKHAMKVVIKSRLIQKLIWSKINSKVKEKTKNKNKKAHYSLLASILSVVIFFVGRIAFTRF